MAKPWSVIKAGPNFVEILDQRLLPASTRYWRCERGDDVVEAIQTLAVRGAPLIGLAAVYGLWLFALESEPHRVVENVARGAAKLKGARPTAVNLGWAVDRALEMLGRESRSDAHTIASSILHLAQVMEAEDRDQNLRIGNYGAELFMQPVRILTHCNTGSLATAGYGTALGIVRSLHRRGLLQAVYADETRPLLQGARLTAWELQQDGIDPTVIPDSAAAALMQRGRVDAVIVGADRITRNGDTANKIGTLMLAVLAQHYQVPFLVAAPWSTVDLALTSGGEIPIEERSPKEVAEFVGQAVLPSGVSAWNPAFDVTPAELVTAIVTDRGVVRPPFLEQLERLKSN